MDLQTSKTPLSIENPTTVLQFPVHTFMTVKLNGFVELLAHQKILKVRIVAYHSGWKIRTDAARLNRSAKVELLDHSGNLLESKLMELQQGKGRNADECYGIMELAEIASIMAVAITILQDIRTSEVFQHELNDLELNTCPICLDEFVNPVRTSCNHVFCKGCLTPWFDGRRNCPLCRMVV